MPLGLLLSSIDGLSPCMCLPSVFRHFYGRSNCVLSLCHAFPFISPASLSLPSIRLSWGQSLRSCTLTPSFRPHNHHTECCKAQYRSRVDESHSLQPALNQRPDDRPLTSPNNISTMSKHLAGLSEVNPRVSSHSFRSVMASRAQEQRAHGRESVAHLADHSWSKRQDVPRPVDEGAWGVRGEGHVAMAGLVKRMKSKVVKGSSSTKVVDRDVPGPTWAEALAMSPKLRQISRNLARVCRLKRCFGALVDCDTAALLPSSASSAPSESRPKRNRKSSGLRKPAVFSVGRRRGHCSHMSRCRQRASMKRSR